METKRKCYTMVTFLFHLSLVYQYQPATGRKFNICECLRKVLNSLLTLYILFRTLLLIKYNLTFHGKYANFILDSITSIVFRLLLLKQASALKNIEKRLHKLTHPKDELFYRNISVWCFFNLIYNVLVFSIITYFKEQSDNLKDCKVGVFGYQECSDLAEKIKIKISFFVYIVMFIMPLGTFSIFYVVTCNRICLVLRHFKRSLSVKIPPDYKRLLADYLKMKKLVLQVDNGLCSLLFVFLLSNTGFLFSVYHVFLDLTVGQYDEYSLGRLATLLYGTLLFFFVYIAAQGVSDVSLDIVDDAKHLPQNPQQSYLDHILFILNIDKGIAMTMFGGIHINKQFFLVYFGTAISYLVLFNSLAR